MKNFHRYLPLSDMVRKRDIYIMAGGFYHIPPHVPYPPAIHPEDHSLLWEKGRTLQEYQLIYITRGEGVFESESGGTRVVTAGTLFALFPSEWHRYSPHLEMGWNEYWVAFQGPLAQSALTECQLSPSNPLLELGVHANIIEEFLQIYEEIKAEAAGHQPVLGARTQLILGLASATVLRSSLEGTDLGRTIEKAKCLLMERVDQPVNMEDLATELNVGYSWFRRMFRQYTGISPAHYHQQLRLNKACEQLRTTELPIALISQNLGFDSAEYFTRIFKSKLKYSPREYRNMTQTPSNPLKIKI